MNEVSTSSTNEPSSTDEPGSTSKTRTLSADLPHVRPGSIVRLTGWVHRRRELSAVTFLILRDRTGLAQVVVKSGIAVPPEETTVEVIGTATANAQAPGGIEVTDPAIRLLGEPADTPAVGNTIALHNCVPKRSLGTRERGTGKLRRSQPREGMD